MIDSQVSLMFFLQIKRAPSPTVLLEGQVQVQLYCHLLIFSLFLDWFVAMTTSESYIILYSVFRELPTVQTVHVWLM